MKRFPLPCPGLLSRSSLHPGLVSSPIAAVVVLDLSARSERSSPLAGPSYLQTLQISVENNQNILKCFLEEGGRKEGWGKSSSACSCCGERCRGCSRGERARGRPPHGWHVCGAGSRSRSSHVAFPLYGAQTANGQASELRGLSAGPARCGKSGGEPGFSHCLDYTTRLLPEEDVAAET